MHGIFLARNLVFSRYTFALLVVAYDFFILYVLLYYLLSYLLTYLLTYCIISYTTSLFTSRRDAVIAIDSKCENLHAWLGSKFFHGCSTPPYEVADKLPH